VEKYFFSKMRKVAFERQILSIGFKKLINKAIVVVASALA
jgi:hypothetical protein